MIGILSFLHFFGLFLMDKSTIDIDEPIPIFGQNMFNLDVQVVAVVNRNYFLASLNCESQRFDQCLIKVSVYCLRLNLDLADKPSDETHRRGLPVILNERFFFLVQIVTSRKKNV